jgi:hypothetical protein
MYFAVQAMAAELSTELVMYQIQKKSGISMLVANNKGVLLKKPLEE